MSTWDRATHRRRRRARELVGRLAADARGARIAAGLSTRDVARELGTSHSRVSRFERGKIASPDLAFLVGVCETVGLDLALRAYPGGDPLRDRAHRDLLERLRGRLASTLRWRVEVPLPTGDRRAWDAVITGQGWRLCVEAETAVTDGQALERRLALKRRDDPGGHVLLVVSDTRRNRIALTVTREELRTDYPVESREMLRALAAGRDPGGSGIAVL